MEAKEKDISYDEKRQRVTLDFGKKIQYSGEAVLTVKFEGTINNVQILGLHNWESSLIFS